MGKYLSRITSFTGNIIRRAHSAPQARSEHAVRLTPKRFLGIKIGDNIRYGSKKVGFVDYKIETGHCATEADFPADWFVEGSKPDNSGSRRLKPFMWVNELWMKDRKGKVKLLPRDKKFGAMTMKELLKVARESGCDSRIALIADSLENFQPGKFYNKMGFSLTPWEQAVFERLEKKYLAKFAELKKRGFADAEIDEFLLAQGYLKPTRINGRFYQETGRYNLTNPECIINYEV